MKITLLYKNNTPADREIQYLSQRLQKIKVPVTLMDADSRDAAALSELYDLVERPALFITDDDGLLIEKWQGKLPSAEEVSGLYRR